VLNLLIKVILINLAAALIVFILSNYVEAFHSIGLSDFLFFIVIVIWGLAKLLWDGGHASKVSRVDNYKTDDVYNMVKGHDFDGEQQEHARQNYQTGLVLFIAGLPAFITCLIMTFF